MQDISSLNFSQLKKQLESGEITSEQLVNQSLKQINKYDSVLGAFISVDEQEKLLELALASDNRRKNNLSISAIDGIPIAIKDNIHSKGLQTTCGSKILGKYYPAEDATVVSQIKKSGGIVIGKTNLDEFAMGSTTENSALKTTKNPWDIKRVPGGSSGGSAVSISAGMSVLALGSDTGGSIRQPAAFCGVVGIKPTYGLVSRYGLVAYASSLDQIGTFSKDVKGASELLSIISKFDSLDSTLLDTKDNDFSKEIGKNIKGLKIAVFPEFFQAGVSDKIKTSFENSLELLKKEGATVEQVSFEYIKYAISTYYFIASAEAASNLSRYDGVRFGHRSAKQRNFEEMVFATRSEGFGKEVKKRILLGNFVLSSGYYDAYYSKAQKVRTFIMEEIKKIFKKFDVIAMPTAPDIAFPFGEGFTDPMKLYLSDITTVLANLGGFPAISIPSDFIDGMPIGIQFMGNVMQESLLFKVAHFFEKSVNLNLNPPIGGLEKHSTNNDTSQKKAEMQSNNSAIYSKEFIKNISTSYNNRVKNYSQRSLCNDLRKHLGKSVLISGWIHKIIKLGGIEFYILRDMTGMTQLVIEKDIDAPKMLLETVIEVEGLVTEEERSAYDHIEIKVEKIKILGKSDSNIPVNIDSLNKNVTLPIILDNRTLSVRNPSVLLTFKIQSEIVKLFGDFLRQNNFTEIKTPKIISSGTEGGTNIFEVKYFDKIAFLAQSPQFYKQIMVGSGLERVFEVGPVFRAEKHDTIRHLNEYTSLDFEMGFIKDEQDVIDMQENLIKYILTGIKEKFGKELALNNINLTIPNEIPRIHFLEALDIALEYGVKNMDGDISPEGEVVICKHFLEKENAPFVYIVGYPVKKRPMYTMPDERLPGYTRSFDLLYRGIEITTGGMRINDYEMLKASIKEFGGNPKSFTQYLNIFKYGMPPHGGLGMGLERITMKILGLKNIREASLFPRDTSRLSP